MSISASSFPHAAAQPPRVCLAATALASATANSPLSLRAQGTGPQSEVFQRPPTLPLTCVPRPWWSDAGGRRIVNFWMGPEGLTASRRWARPSRQGTVAPVSVGGWQHAGPHQVLRRVASGYPTLRGAGRQGWENHRVTELSPFPCTGVILGPRCRGCVGLRLTQCQERSAAGLAVGPSLYAAPPGQVKGTEPALEYLLCARCH